MDNLIINHTCAPVNPTATYRAKPESVILQASAAHIETARVLAGMRTSLHDGRRKAHEDLGGDANREADYVGLLAELTILIALIGAGFRPTQFTLLANPTPSGPDFALNGKTFNVKALPQGKRFLCVNERQRTDPRQHSDFYLPMQFLTPTTLRVLKPIASAAVCTWPLREMHSAYRSTDVATLPALQDLKEVAQCR